MDLNLIPGQRFPKIFSTAVWTVYMVTIASTLGNNLPAQAQSLTFQGTTSGQWAMPSNPSGSTFLSGENSSVDNRLTWGRVDNCLGCTSFTNYVQYNGLGF